MSEKDKKKTIIHTLFLSTCHVIGIEKKESNTTRKEDIHAKISRLAIDSQHH